MIFDILPVVIIIVALGCIVFIVSKKIPYIQGLHLDDLPKKHTDVKRAIMENRLKRKFGSLLKVIVAQPLKQIVAVFKKIFVNVHNFVQEKKAAMEEKRNVMTKGRVMYDVGSGEKALSPIDEARELIGEERYEQAEAKFIEQIKVDPKSKDAFEGLAKLYKMRKNFPDAEAALEHVLKLTRREHDKPSATAYIELAEMKNELKKEHEALHYAMKAVEGEPQNPKMLDYCLEMCLTCKAKNDAWELYGKLKEVNPENQKLEEFKKRLLALG